MGWNLKKLMRKLLFVLNILNSRLRLWLRKPVNEVKIQTLAA